MRNPQRRMWLPKDKAADIFYYSKVILDRYDMKKYNPMRQVESFSCPENASAAAKG